MNNSPADPYINIYSSSDDVTGNCTTLEIVSPYGRKYRIQIDCGIHEGNEYLDLNKEFVIDPKTVDAILLTHIHSDHVGLLPKAIAEGFNGPIYCTNFTKYLLPKQLELNYKINTYQNMHEKGKSNIQFKENDLKNTLLKIIGVRYNKTIEFNKNISFTFLGNGHVLGAACILVTANFPGKKPIKVLFTGDYAQDNNFFIVPLIKKSVKESELYIVQESTYGSVLSDEVQRSFAYQILKSLSEKKTIIISAFAFERFQTILLDLKKLQDNGFLPENIEIYAEGESAIDYNKLLNKYFKRNPKSFRFKENNTNFTPHNLKIIDSKTRKNIIADKKPKIIVCTSGMCSYGPSNFYLRTLLNDERVTFLLSGYAAKESVAREVLELPKGEIYTFKDGYCVRKNANIELVKDYSSHAKSDELIAFLKQFSNIKGIFIYHGSEENRKAYIDKVFKETSIQSVISLKRDIVVKLNACKVLKTFNRDA